MERQAAKHGLVPWHIYRRLPVMDRAEIIAFHLEDGIREGIRAQRLEAKNKNKQDRPSMSVEDWLLPGSE